MRAFPLKVPDIFMKIENWASCSENVNVKLEDQRCRPIYTVFQVKYEYTLKLKILI